MCRRGGVWRRRASLCCSMNVGVLGIWEGSVSEEGNKSRVLHLLLFQEFLCSGGEVCLKKEISHVFHTHCCSRNVGVLGGKCV